MSYELSFSPEFFLAEGEPYDRSDLALNRSGKPVSVWSAIEHMRTRKPKTFAAMAKDCFGLSKGEYLDTESVLERIQETNTCGDLSSPVDVWVDAQGDYTIEVWDTDN